MTYGAVNWPVVSPDRANYRMLCLADLARAITENRAPRASGELAIHALDVMEKILLAGETGTPQVVDSMTAQPAQLSEGEAQSLLA